MEEWKIDANDMDFDELKLHMKSGLYEQCPECHTYIQWSKIPDENVIKGTEHEEFWGAPCSYEIVIGWVCPACNERVEF